MASSASKAEQRSSRRFALKVPVSIRCDEATPKEIPAETRDLSAQGVFFYTGESLAEGSKLEFTLTLPPEITLTESIRVRCRGKVIRIHQDRQQTGIAAIIEQYDFVPDGA
ncbi:MAG: PilZ domain-containing protein [Acidobacteria bacterium]|nr:PilZ domain-containing protein [Acidobacteriota bacterium]MBV9146452.1 PilZ domain-containing protein [Acidobacteriota bacterium]MBV9434821.1 PilZ domain-containing protein [Acidobacteriota bacterium]